MADFFKDGAVALDLAFGDVVIDRADERVIGPDGPLKLGNKAFRVLLLLAEHDGRLLTKDALFSSVWDGTTVSESSLTSVIKELRRALGDESRTPRYIESVYGRGYRLIAPVRAADDAHADPDAARQPRTMTAPGKGDGGKGDGSPVDRPPLVLVSQFHDSAIRASHPYCAAELREEVLSGLARVREIQLVADDRGEINFERVHAADRGYQLTATLLPERDGVKVIARAKRLGDGVIVWAETMSLVDNGTANGVERIVRRIVGAVLPAVDDDVFADLPRDSGDLYDRYLLAKRRSVEARDYATARGAADALEAIIAERPDFGLAYPPLVRLYNTDFGYTAFGSTGEQERAHALRLAKRGLSVDRANAQAHMVLGFCYLWHDERALARNCFARGLSLNPYNHVRLQEAATALTYMGDVEGAHRLMDAAAEFNPNPDDNFHEDFGRLQLVAGDYDAARASLEAIVQGSIWAELYLGACQIALGRDTGPATLARWRERVERCWHAGRAPERHELIGWVVRHHPLPADSGATFFAHVEAGLVTVSS